MTLDVKLDAFEGPLDLLLHLIEKNKIDIYDIPIAEITEQYLAYVREIPAEDMERASAFIVMAATLIEIKSKMLLPPEEDEEGEPVDPREELVQQLLSYKLCRYAADELRGRQDEASHYFYKDATMPREVLSFRPTPDVDAYCAGVELGDLKKTFESLMRRQIDRIDEQHASFGRIEKETVTLPEKMEILHTLARRRRTFSFRGLLEGAQNKMDVVVTFVALLEMIRQGEVTVRQESLFDDIEITSRITGEDGDVPGTEGADSTGSQASMADTSGTEAAGVRSAGTRDSAGAGSGGADVGAAGSGEADTDGMEDAGAGSDETDSAAADPKRTQKKEGSD